MAQANSNNTTFVPDDSTRRGFLGCAVAALAAGTAVNVTALATIRPAAAASDPIFAAIDAHKRALDAVVVACAEQARIMEVAKDSVGDDNISLFDMREIHSPPGFHPVVRVSHWTEIETYVPRELHPVLHDFCVEQQKQQSKTYADFIASISPGGDLDSVLGDLPQVEWAAATQLAETVPTTTAGVLALLQHAGEALAKESSFVDDERLISALFGSLTKAARALTPLCV